MRILITNDDGISAPGLTVAEEIARKFGGPDADIWTVAPAFEQSGVAHCISYTKPVQLQKLSDRRFTIDGSPADCVLAALHDVMEDARPDLILSGVNRGNNAGENVLYSGTIGGAMEGALHGVPSIALSQFMGPGTAALDDPFEAARVYGADTVARIWKAGIWPSDPYHTFYNVNFPPVGAADVTGTSATRQGKRPAAGFGMDGFLAPNGRRYLWVTGSRQDDHPGPGTDVGANLDGEISITPLRADLTAHDLMDAVADAIG
ncbi:5'/3'-nucleotidase SurE [Oceanomicrobium pacificus]|uniref:5'-nucleotidase SurE n=1 Tax=Oceanomicrobium pacificus TaxID=2692916 RepID=A0A6B0TSB8_9RHOB|nr:5'/3'-nucleotidase SurE [Oceanomicrobium pacificus]MXU65629.1 5'/3'-nucleotidase SurE [Oceanomicrobium pacificus]